ncbi:UNVERIFIED_CONTAM: gamma-glutamyltransferase family protein [Halobacillus marinus]
MAKINHLHYPYQSRRVSTTARKGMVATSQPLAAQIGLDILKKGGNAVDAAIASAAALTVVEPTSNGIGGDAFALVWINGKLHGLNGSGPAPSGISINKMKALGYEEMPQYGWMPVTVPGAPGAWVELSKKFGKLPFRELLEPAIAYAKEGFAVSPIVSKLWNRAYERYKHELTREEFSSWFDTFAPGGKVPKAGDTWQSTDHAATLAAIAETEGADFYTGELADRIAAFSEQCGGFLTKEDLSGYKPEWVDPVSVPYRGYEVWEMPPNGQGIVALMALRLLDGFSFEERDSGSTFHKQIEAMKLAFADGGHYIAEKHSMRVDVDELLSEAYADSRRGEIGAKAALPAPGNPSTGGTVYLAAADEEGNMVSFIQSNYNGFGSGLVVPGTGIALQNRGRNFSFDPDHPNCLEGGKRSYHTIIPGFLTCKGQAVGPFGVMGEFMQPQGHVQVIMNMIDFHLNPQASLDAPRWQWKTGRNVLVESDFPLEALEALRARGHEIEVMEDRTSFGRGQIIWRDSETGTLYGGTESRTDGSVAAW